ncbi:MAG TPA: tRNA epoxyqueuosine(34) reductase QueG [Bacteroidales bacterium]|nr:tRNA epoxyqueuosine(34) reductase QueG [Bacteroidales bacterium]
MIKLDSFYVKKLATNIGFEKCGISKAVVSDSNIVFFENWLELGFHADMKYISENKQQRINPSELVENAKSIISVILNYRIAEPFKSENYSISKYALVTDYHIVIQHKLEILLHNLKEKYPYIKARISIDSAPVLERYFAMSAGLGFIGKNTCLINPELGSWVFLGEIITDAEFELYDSPTLYNCGECNKCIDSCPCGALSENGLNANKCISYHTVENKHNIPEHIADKITDQLFGCDICQDVCPFNSKNTSTNTQFSDILGLLEFLKLEELGNISNREFNRRFANTSLLRSGRKKIIENFSHLKPQNNSLG